MDKAKTPELSLEEIAAFESAFAEKDPIPLLRKHAQELSAAGMKRGDIYLRFLAFDRRLTAEGREDDVAILEDVMDMITDTYAPFNLNLPK